MIPNLAQAFPAKLRASAEAAIPRLKLSSDYCPGYFVVNVLGGAVTIPNRIYRAPWDPDVNGLTMTQRQVLRCLQTRSADGFERQRALQEVLRTNTAWSIPFVVALIGEYVVEILDDIYAALPQLNTDVVARFIDENPDIWHLTQSRVVSYWDCYYRNRFSRQDYVGFKLLTTLETLHMAMGSKDDDQCARIMQNKGTADFAD